MKTLTSSPDSELVLMLKLDNEEAFTEIYNRYWKKLYVVACNKLGNFAEAEEVVQNIFLSIWFRRATIEIASNLNAYLAVCVKYKVIKALNKRFHQKKYLASLNDNDILDNSTQEWLQFEEMKGQLSKLVADLPTKCQLVYRLSKEEGLSQKKIAEDLGISQKTVEAHLTTAIKKLKAGLSLFFFTLL
ncbi:RNA polymerase sigma-70 factor (family 1) [Pedobacter sp. UYEF25]